MGLDDIDYDALPEDPEQAFLVIEAAFRRKLESETAFSQDTFHRVAYFEYMNKVWTAASSLQLDLIEDLQTPYFEHMTEEYFRAFVARVDAHCTHVRIIQGRRNRSFSVAFDLAAKTKIKHYLDKIREIVEKAELDDRKKEALLARLAAIQTELDRRRTRFEAFGAYVIETAGIIGEVAQRLQPLTDSVARIFGAAKSHEDANPALPKPPDLKRIEHRKADADSSDLDDIPF